MVIMGTKHFWDIYSLFKEADDGTKPGLFLYFKDKGKKYNKVLNINLRSFYLIKIMMRRRNSSNSIVFVLECFSHLKHFNKKVIRCKCQSQYSSQLRSSHWKFQLLCDFPGKCPTRNSRFRGKPLNQVSSFAGMANPLSELA